MSLTESVRQAYLEQLGLETYMPRVQLSGAPISALCTQFEPATLELSVKDSSAVHGTELDLDIQSCSTEPKGPSDGGTSELNSTLNTVPVDEGSQSQEGVKPTEIEVTDKLIEGEPVSFMLSVWHFNDDILIVDSRHTELALPTEKLLRNILRALGRNISIPKAEVIRWPLPGSLSISEDKPHAQEMLQTFFEARLSIQPVKAIILMGRDAADYILPDGTSYDDQLGQSITLPYLNIEAKICSSLADMLLTPQDKIQTWQALKPLTIRSAISD